MKYLIIGGTGQVGSRIAHQLLDEKENVTILSRHPEKKRIPTGAKTIKGDLQNPDDLRKAFKGVDAVFMANTVSPTECHEGLMAVNAAMEAKVNRFVYLSVHHVDKAPHIPRFGSKVAIEEALKSSRLSYGILRANNFYQNDPWYVNEIYQQNSYSQPIGSVGLSRVDVRDVADAAVVMLTTKKLEKQVVSLAGPDVLTGEKCAQIWSDTTGKMISYTQIPMAQWEKKARKTMPDWMVYDFRVMFEFFQAEGLKATQQELKDISRLLGHPPRTYADYVKELAAKQRKVASAS
jgi:uncharacterized protein YbjT (DUF2867 family)